MISSIYTTIKAAAGLLIQAMYYALVAVFRGHSLPRYHVHCSVMNIIHIPNKLCINLGHGPIPKSWVLGVSISTWLSKVVGPVIIGYTLRNY